MPMRTHYCGLVTEQLIGQTVTLTGWPISCSVTRPQ